MTNPAAADTFTRLTDDVTSGSPEHYFGHATGLGGGLAVVSASGGVQDNKDLPSLAGAFYVFDAATGQQLLRVDDPSTDPFAIFNEFGAVVSTNGGVVVTGSYIGEYAQVFDVDAQSPTFGSHLTNLTPSSGPTLYVDDAVVSGQETLIGFNGGGVGVASIFDIDPSSPTFGDERVTFTTSSAGAISRGFGEEVAFDGTTALVAALYDNALPDEDPIDPPVLDLVAAESNANVSGTGAVYVYDAATGAETARLAPTNGDTWDFFGSSLALGAGVALVGSERHDTGGLIDSGSAYLFDVDPLSPTFGSELVQLSAPDGVMDDYFGARVAISGTTALVLAPGDDNPTSMGSLYLYDVDPASATFGDLLDTVPAPDGRAFKGEIAVDGDQILVGSPYEDSDRGAAYLFSLSEVLSSTTCIAGDANCDGFVDVGGDIFPAFANFTGPGSFGKTRAEGDVQGSGDICIQIYPSPCDTDVDVSDILAMFASFTGPPPPEDEAGGLVAAEALDSTIPDLIYDASTGEVLLDLDSAVGFTGYVLNSANGFITGNHTPFMAGVTTTLPYELAEATFGTPAGPYPKSIGNVFPSGMDMTALSAFLTGNQVSRGNNQPIVPFDLVIVNPVSSGVPEPAAVVMGIMALAGLGMVAYRRRRNG